MSFHIVLVEPEIPPNTGNIARTCAITGAKLHLVEPLGFDISEKALKRAGLDYWDLVDLKVYKNLKVFMEENVGMNMYFVSKRGKRVYSDIQYKGEEMFLFGRETAGLDKTLLNENVEKTIRIPMGENEKLRSLNLSNSANIVLYEALRQNGFEGLI